MTLTPDPANRWLAEAGGRAATYDRRWEEMAAAGQPVHGEADLVWSLLTKTVVLAESVGLAHNGATILDAGCGTGRVAAELARRGAEVVGVDLDPAMLAKAADRSTTVRWIHADLATMDLGRRFHLVVAAGNVMIFLAPGTESAVISNLVAHLLPGGILVAGFSVEPGRLALATYEQAAEAAGLSLMARLATWESSPETEGFGINGDGTGGDYTGGNYAVSIHRLLPA
ncbi:MAG: class I SAM-dependent DNA methyltransferase [Acidimicrobiales bacterium]